MIRPDTSKRQIKGSVTLFTLSNFSCMFIIIQYSSIKMLMTMTILATAQLPPKMTMNHELYFSSEIILNFWDTIFLSEPTLTCQRFEIDIRASRFANYANSRK